MQVSISLATVDDFSELAPLINAFHNEEQIKQSSLQRDNALLSLLKNASLGEIHLLKEQNIVLGYIIICFGFSVEFGGRDAFIDELFIQPTARRNGLASLLINHIINRLAAMDINALHLEVGNTNTSAFKLYESIGFSLRNKNRLMSKRLIEKAPGTR